MKVNMSGVLPVIFASSILSLPPTVQMFLSEDKQEKYASFFELFSSSHWFYAILYFFLILFFAYFYASIQYNPVEMANNIRKNSGMIPGLRPGKPTADYIKKILNRITLLGAMIVAFIAVFPMLVIVVEYYVRGGYATVGQWQSWFGPLSFIGSSLIIVVGVALETVRELEAQMSLRNYKGFLD
jgi:preprotein translocase subunit SecY